MSEDRAAQLSPICDPDWPVWLSGKGVRMVAAALEAVRRRAAANGSPPSTPDFDWLTQVLRLAATPATSTSTSTSNDEGSDAGTKSEEIQIRMPSSAPDAQLWLGTRAAADLAGVSDRTIRKAIAAGHLHAERPAHCWLINETEVRRWAGTRRPQWHRRDGASQRRTSL